MPELPDDLVDVSSPQGLPADLVSVGGSGAPDDLVEVEPRQPSTFERATLALHRGIFAAGFGNDPNAEGVERVGKLARMDNGDFIEMPDGTQRAFSNLDFIAEDENGELAVFRRPSDEGFLGRAKRAADVVALGVAGSTLTRAGKTISVASEAEKATDAAVFVPPPPVSRAQTPLEAAGAARVAGVPEGLPPSGPSQAAGNINLSRIHAPDDVKQVIQETAEQNAQFEGARRGVVTQDETRDMARLVGMTPEKLAQRMEGQAFNAEQMFAARQLLVEQATRVRNLARNATGGSDLDKATFAEEMNRLVAIQEQVSGATAEAGRTLQQFRMMAGASRAEISKLVEASKAGGLDDIIEGVRRLDNAPIEDVATFVGNALKPKFSDKLYEVWINALLSGPTTHATNTLSNALVSALAIPEAVIAAGVSKATGSGIKVQESVGRFVGLFEGMKEGVRAALKAFRTEEPLFGAGKIEARRQQAIGGVTGKTVRVPGRLLTAEDAFFKSIGYRQEINATATRQALSEDLAGKALAKRITQLRANPTDEMINSAKAVADKQTFTNDLGEAGKALQKFVRRVPGARVIAPFIRTPSNIVKFAAERSPFAPLMKESREILAGKQGAVARDQLIAKMAVGSSIGATAGYMASQGIITGGGPVDPRKRAVLYRSGWQPYSVRVGDDHYSFSRLEPLAMLMGVSADFAELQDVMNDEEKKGLAALITGSVSRNLTSKTWLRGLSDMMEAVNDPNRHGQGWIQNLAGTAVPTGVAQLARSRDPFLREARSTLDQIRSRIPGFRESLPFRRDLFGEPIKLDGAVGPDILSPIYFSASDDDLLVDQMIKLGVAPSRPARNIRGVDLTPQQHEAYTVATGQNARRFLDMITKQPGWDDLPKNVKQDAFEDAFRQARDVARSIVVSQFPDLRDAIVQKKLEDAQ